MRKLPSLSVALKNRNNSYSSKVRTTPRRFLKAVLPLVERFPSQASHACKATMKTTLEVASHHENENDSSKAKLAERATLVKPP
jgi:ribosomal protein S20